MSMGASKLKGLRDRPFNLKGGGYGFLFRSEIFFSDNTRVRIFFFCHAKRNFFFQNITLGYTTNTLNQIFFYCCISHNDHGMQNTNKTTIIDSLSGFRQLLSDIHLYPNYFFIKRPLLFCSEMGSMLPSSGDDRWVMSCVHFCSEMGSMLPSNGDDHWVMS